MESGKGHFNPLYGESDCQTIQAQQNRKTEPDFKNQAQRELTVREAIDRKIEKHAREIHRLELLKRELSPLDKPASMFQCLVEDGIGRN